MHDILQVAGILNQIQNFQHGFIERLNKFHKLFSGRGKLAPEKMLASGELYVFHVPFRAGQFENTAQKEIPKKKDVLSTNIGMEFFVFILQNGTGVAIVIQTELEFLRFAETEQFF